MEAEDSHNWFRLVDLLGVYGSASLNSVDGNIIADFKKIDQSKPIMISSLEGDLELRVPENSSMNFVVKSSKNEIKTDLDIIRSKRPSVVRQNKEKKVVTLDDWTYASLNGGGQDCTMSTYNGTISIKKRQ